MSLKIRRILYLFIATIIFLYALNFIDKTLERKSSNYKYTDFFEQSKKGLDFDILFLGTSHVINAVFPMELWNDYGYVSYNFGGHANRLATTYWVMQNALDYTTPKLAVIDCSGISDDRKVYENEEYVHLSLDAFPLSITKIKTVFDLIEEKSRLSYLWDFVVYHNRWNDLSKEDFIKEYSYEKGAESVINVAIPGYIEYVDENAKKGADTISSEYLCKIIEACQARQIDVLLTYLPFPATKGWKEEANYINDIAQQYGIHYINFFDLDVVNFNTDCYDSNSHLNQSGGYKITDYLGQYIQENYNIEDHRTDETYNFWNEDYQEYRKKKKSALCKLQRLDQYLLALSDSELSTCFYIRPGSPILYDQRMIELINNISQTNSPLKIKVAADSGAGYFCIIDNQKHILEETTGSLEQYETKTIAGNISAGVDEDDKPYIIIKDQVLPLYDSQKGVYSDITIMVFDNKTAQILDTAVFNIDYDLIPIEGTRSEMDALL